AEKILVTGQTLSCGIGPASFLTGERLIKKRKFPLFWARVKEGPKPTEAVDLDKHLASLMPNWFGTATVVKAHHRQVTFGLSQKDILRWQRAGSAFAREIVSGNDLEIHKDLRHRRLRTLYKPPQSSSESFKQCGLALRSKNFEIEAWERIAGSEEN